MSRRTLMAVLAAAIGGLAAPAAAPAATPPQAFGTPVSTVPIGCPAPAGSPAPLAADHPDAMARVTIDPVTPGWSGALRLGTDTSILSGDNGEASSARQWWWTGGSLTAGHAPRPVISCAAGDPSVSGKVEYFDRPSTPLSFSDPDVSSAFQVLGFRAAVTGIYVADVSVRSAWIWVFSPDWQTGTGADDATHRWLEQLEAPDGDTVTTTLPLGRLTAGPHDLPFGFDGSGGGGRSFTITVRASPDANKTPPTAEDPPATPPVTAPGPAATADPQATTPIPAPVTTITATAPTPEPLGGRGQRSARHSPRSSSAGTPAHCRAASRTPRAHAAPSPRRAGRAPPVVSPRSTPREPGNRPCASPCGSPRRAASPARRAAPASSAGRSESHPGGWGR
jgi:hypothetical protein